MFLYGGHRSQLGFRIYFKRCFCNPLYMADAHGEMTIGEVVRESADRFTPSERRVARVLLAAYPIAGLESITQLAERAGVSGPTVMRFVNRLGFGGYPHFQRALREEIQARISSPLSLYQRRTQPAERGGVLASSLETFVRSLEATFGAIPSADFEAALDLFADRRRKVLSTGGRFSQVAAYYLEAHLHMLRSNTRFIPVGPTPRIDELIDVDRRDVLAVFDYRRYQKDTVEFARRAADRGATVVLFTDPWLSPIAGVAECVLPADIEAPSPFDSLVSAMAIVETVIAGLVLRLGETPKERLQELESLRVGFTWDQTGIEKEKTDGP